MSQRTDALKETIGIVFGGILSRLDSKSDKSSLPRTVVNEYTTITAGSTKNYDIQALLGEDHTRFDKKTADITVRVKDGNQTSPLYNIYANAEAILAYGLTSDERYVVLANQATFPVEVYVKVVVQPTTGV